MKLDSIASFSDQFQEWLDELDKRVPLSIVDEIDQRVYMPRRVQDIEWIRSLQLSCAQSLDRALAHGDVVELRRLCTHAKEFSTNWSLSWLGIQLSQRNKVIHIVPENSKLYASIALHEDEGQKHLPTRPHSFLEREDALSASLQSTFEYLLSIARDENDFAGVNFALDLAESLQLQHTSMQLAELADIYNRCWSMDWTIHFKQRTLLELRFLLTKKEADFRKPLDVDVMEAAWRDLIERGVQESLESGDFKTCESFCNEAASVGLSPGFIQATREQIADMWSQAIAESTAHWNGPDASAVMELCDWAEKAKIIAPLIISNVKNTLMEALLQVALDQSNDFIQIARVYHCAKSNNACPHLCELAARKLKEPHMFKEAVTHVIMMNTQLVERLEQLESLANFASLGCCDHHTNRALVRALAHARLLKISGNLETLRGKHIIDFTGNDTIKDLIESFQHWISNTVFSAVTPCAVIGLAQVGFLCQSDARVVAADAALKSIVMTQLSLSTETHNFESLSQACSLAEEAGCCQDDMIDAQKEFVKLWIHREIMQSSAAGLMVACDWARNRGIWGETCELASREAKKLLCDQLNSMMAIEPPSWTSIKQLYFSAKQAGVEESILENVRAKLNGLTKNKITAAMASGLLCEALRTCHTTELLDDSYFIKSIEDRINTLWVEQLEHAVRDRKPNVILWACTDEYGAQAAGVSAVEALELQRQAKQMLIERVAQLEHGNYADLARAYNDAVDAGVWEEELWFGPRLLFKGVSKQQQKDQESLLRRVSAKLNEVRACAAEIESIISGHALEEFERKERRSSLPPYNYPRKLTKLGQKERLAHFVCRIAIVQAAHRVNAQSAEYNMLQGAECPDIAGRLAKYQLTLHACGPSNLHSTICRSGNLLADAICRMPRHLGPSAIDQFRQFLAAAHVRIFSLADQDYGYRGNYKYHKPIGWIRWTVSQERFDQYRDWPICYHGTSLEKVPHILSRGLQCPGQEGVDISHGQAHSRSGSSIYLSPSIGYASHPVYSQFFDLGEQHWGQVVFQCRVKPGSFVEASGTLGGKHWVEGVRFDPNFSSMNRIEWLVESPSDAVVCGLMLREFGSGADLDLYGQLANSVVEGEQGACYEWTSLLCATFKAAGHMIYR